MVRLSGGHTVDRNYAFGQRIREVTRPIIRILSTDDIPYLLLGMLAALGIAKIGLLLTVEFLIQEDMILFTGRIDNVPPMLMALGYQWDSRHFLAIVENGYPSNPDDPLLYAFAPLYPAFVSMVCWLTSNMILSAVLVSNVFHFASILSFYKVARLYLDYYQACIACLLFGVFPTYLVYGTLAYSEAPFIFFSTLSWFYLQKSNYPISSILLTLAILTRFIGVLIFGIYLLIGLRRVLLTNEPKIIKHINIRGAVWFTIPVLSTLLLFSYFYVLSGDFMIAFAAHGRFDDSIGIPMLSQLVWYFEGFFVELNPWVDPFQLALERYVFVLPYLLLALANFKWNKEIAIYASITMVFVTSLTGIAGIAAPRIMLAAWPSILPLARLRNPLLLFVLVLLFFMGSCWVMLQFQTGFFA